MTIYLDYNATTPVDPRVAEEMLPFIYQHFGNPSSIHSFGDAPRKAIEQARSQIASLIGASFLDEIIFTGGGSEGNNLVIQGVAFANRHKGKHLITSSTEHPSVLDTCDYLTRIHGFEVSYIGVDSFGRVDPQEIEKQIRPDTILITVMHSNNETGTIQPITEIGKIGRKYQILFHTDAAQSIGKVNVNVEELNVDLLTLVGHKFYAPKGIGALYIRRGTQLERQIRGANHESGYRSGTENVPYIVAIGEAARLAKLELKDRIQHFSKLRDHIFTSLLNNIEGVYINGHPTHRLPNTLNVGIQGVVSYELLEKIPKLAASTGSACHSGQLKPSAVLKSMGLPDQLALSAIRISLGTLTTLAESEETAKLIIDATTKLRMLNPNPKEKHL